MTIYGNITPIVGSTSRLLANVVDVTGAPVNPDTLSITLRCQGQAVVGPYTYTFPSGDPSNNVVYTGTEGSFYCDFLWPSAGVWSFEWSAQPSSGLDTTATSAITDGEQLVSVSSV